MVPADHERGGPMPSAFEYLTAFKSRTFCDVGVTGPVLEPMRRGLREVKGSWEVMRRPQGVLPTTTPH